MGGEQEDEEDEELYGDLNLNLERRDAKMTNAQVNQEKEEVHVTFTTELPIVQQQSSSVSSDLVSKFMNPTPDTGIVDNYLASKMKDEVNVKAQFKAQVSKILPKVEKFVTESLGDEVLDRSSNQPQTSYAVMTSLSEFELKKILIDKIDENKSMNRSDVSQTLRRSYNTLIELYNSDKDLFASYGVVVTLKRGRGDQDKDEEPSAGSNRGTKPRRSGKEESSKEATQKESKSTSSYKGVSISQPKSSGKSAQAEEHGPRVDDLEEPLHQEFNTRNDDVSPVREIIAVDERLWNPSGSQTPDREWNKTNTVDDRPPQSWMNQLA
ncbi:hypothetical protein Tco_0595686 [Tanacetum coccineum]